MTCEAAQLLFIVCEVWASNVAEIVFPWLEPRLPDNPLTGPATVSR